jgi:hypothetical protein
MAPEAIGRSSSLTTPAKLRRCLEEVRLVVCHHEALRRHLRQHPAVVGEPERPARGGIRPTPTFKEATTSSGLRTHTTTQRSGMTSRQNATVSDCGDPSRTRVPAPGTARRASPASRRRLESRGLTAQPGGMAGGLSQNPPRRASTASLRRRNGRLSPNPSGLSGAGATSSAGEPPYTPLAARRRATSDVPERCMPATQMGISSPAVHRTITVVRCVAGQPMPGGLRTRCSRGSRHRCVTVAASAARPPPGWPRRSRQRTARTCRASARDSPGARRATRYP